MKYQIGTRVLCSGSLPGTGINLNSARGTIKDVSAGGYGVVLDEAKENATYWFLLEQQLTPLPGEAPHTVDTDSIEALTKREYFACHLGSAAKADALINELNEVKEEKPEPTTVSSTGKRK